jgi:hypothetical protein
MLEKAASKSSPRLPTTRNEPLIYQQKSEFFPCVQKTKRFNYAQVL